MSIALCTFAVVPFGDTFLGYNLQVSSLDGGLRPYAYTLHKSVDSAWDAAWNSARKTFRATHHPAIAFIAIAWHRRSVRASWAWC